MSAHPISRAYHDGASRRVPADGTRRAAMVRACRRAVSDCEEMGWLYLRSYFLGQLSALLNYPGIPDS